MADITVTIPNSTFTITEVGSGIEVTTPTSVEVNVDSNSNTIDIVNTPQQITVLTSGTLNINTGNAVTSVNGISGPTVVLDTDDISEGTTNQYFTQARARQSLSAGTGISYDNSTGVITNTSINTNTTYTIDATTATGGANFNLVGSDSSTDTIKIASGTNITVSRTDANTITIDGSDLNTTYAISSASTTGGANLTLTGSDSSTDSVAYKGSGATTVTSTDANTITIASTDTNTTYTQNASATSGGANLNLVGSDSTTDTIKFAEGTGITVVRTDADTITITNTVPDTNTTYTQNISSTTGGANLNLVGSDSTTDTVKFADGTGVTVSYTDANTATIAIGQSVGTGDSPSFAGITGGNITVGVATDNTIASTDTNGNITLDPNGTGNVVMTFANGGNLTNDRNYVAGSVRDATTLAAGDAWSFLSGAANLVRGISIDNTGDTTKRPGVILRANSNNRPMLVAELNRGTVASPLAVANNGSMLEIAASGWNGTQYVTDAIAVAPISLSFTAAEAFTSPSGVNTANGSRLRVDAQPVGVTATALSRSNIINHTATTATYRSDAWTFSTREVAAGGTNTTQMTLDSSGNAVHTGDVAVNGGDLTTTQTTATLFNTNATTLNVGQAATTVSLGATTGTATIRNATTALTGVLRVNGNDIQSSTGAVVMSMSTNDATFADVVQVNGILNVRSGLTYNMLSTTGGASENTLTLLKQDAAASADHAVINFATYRSTAGTYSPTQNGDKLGEFKFNGQYASGASPTSGVPAQILSNATENWTATANGQAIQFWGTKAGTTTGVNVINANPETMFLRSDVITLENAAGTDFVVIDANTAKFNVPVTTEITTTTISEGTTYTPAATVDNNISVQIDTLAGGTTVIDLASLTGNSRGASYNILVFNNTASGTPIQVKNTRINTNNLMTHTITTGSPRIIINAYVVGDYATATHFVVA